MLVICISTSHEPKDAKKEVMTATLHSVECIHEAIGEAYVEFVTKFGKLPPPTIRPGFIPPEAVVAEYHTMKREGGEGFASFEQAVLKMMESCDDCEEVNEDEDKHVGQWMVFSLRDISGGNPSMTDAQKRSLREWMDLGL